jgi:heme-degrading monooxygenase HmoA
MPQIVTAIDAVVPEDRESDLLDGYASMNATTKPEGLVRSELLRGQNGAWRIQTTWRDLEAVIALRKSGEPPAALRLLESVGAEHTHAVFTVEQSYNS